MDRSSSILAPIWYPSLSDITSGPSSQSYRADAAEPQSTLSRERFSPLALLRHRRSILRSLLSEQDRTIFAFVKVFGCRPDDEGATYSGAGVGKPPREETAGRDTWAFRHALWGFDWCR